MATRRAVRESFYDELGSAVGSLVDTGNVSQEEPNSTEDLPAVVHDDDYRPVPMNNKSAATDVATDSNGVSKVTFSTPMEARFTLTILAQDEQLKEDIYESVRSYFEDYTYSASHFPDPSEIQTDVHHVEVRDSNSNDLTEREPPARADVLLVTLGYERLKTGVRSDLADGSGDEDFTFDTIEEVEHNVDADNDGTVDNTYTTTEN
jgi:hypothetical protein